MSSNRSPTPIAILPTIHRFHERPDFRHYSYDVLRDIVVGFRPDIICGEVRPKDWKATQHGKKAGYCGPSEYRKCLLPLCFEEGIRFEPVDFYRDADVGIDRSVTPSPEEKHLADKEMSLLRESDASAIVSPSQALLRVIRAKHALARKKRPQIELATWNDRNERICQNVVRVATRNPSKRILVTIGLEHVPFFQEILTTHYKVTLVPLA